ncbi:MAG: DUF2127 domain-containing protein [Xanthomonadaceae bacterium]|nr:DUF2127 domain-containing protein [Xanthomonadaceae bacterium]
MKFNTKNWWHRAYEIGIVLKGIDGALEVAGALALFLTSQVAIRSVVAFLTREELAEDPNDFIANHAVHMAQNLSAGTRHFAALYLFVHGAIKVGLVIGLLRGLRGAYPIALLFLMAFIGYQIYRLAHASSLALMAFTIIDILIVILIAHEWQRVKNTRSDS